MAKRVFKRKTRKGTMVTSTMVPRKKMGKVVKNYSYGTKSGRSHVVEVKTVKVFKSAKAAAKYRMSQTKKTRR